jgi:excisionase family DNA binding protein
VTTLTRQESAIARVEPAQDVLGGGIREASRRLGVSARKGYRLAAEGHWPFAIRCGQRYLIPRAAFELYLRGQLRPDQPADRQAAPR